MTTALLDPPPKARPTRPPVRSDSGNPGRLETLADFLVWARSERFPETGRYDWVRGRLEVELIESGFSHGGPKAELCRAVLTRMHHLRTGLVFVADMRVTSDPDASAADVSAEPDLVYLSSARLNSGEVRLLEKQGRPGDFTEIVGPPDLVAEVVSDSSVEKDTGRLFREYHLLGVDEYWLVDVREGPISFVIHHRGTNGFVPVPTDADGCVASAVLGCRFRLDREALPTGEPFYVLQQRP